MDIHLRNLCLKDLEKYKYWKSPTHSYHKLNGPYFPKANDAEIDLQIKALKIQLTDNPLSLDNKKIISNDNDDIIGEVSWYWKSQETNWLEIGIVIFDENYWRKGIGFKALKLWIDYLFQHKKEIVRIGLTTWSGNEGMIQLAYKLGMINEATIRKARIIDGVYYDSVSFGILKEEWES